MAQPREVSRAADKVKRQPVLHPGGHEPDVSVGVPGARVFS